MVDLELDELKREFLAEAADKVSDIQAALDGERNSAAFDRLAYLAHQLKGSGGSYGYQRISSEAAELEKAAEALAGTDGNVSPDAEARMQQHVVNLRSEIEKRANELQH